MCVFPLLKELQEILKKLLNKKNGRIRKRVCSVFLWLNGGKDMWDELSRKDRDEYKMNDAGLCKLNRNVCAEN